MPESQEIETTLISDSRKRLDDVGGITNFIEGTSLEESLELPIVSVGVQDLTPDFLDGGGQVPGFYRATMLLDCLSHVDDDLTGAAVRLLAKKVRQAFVVDDIVDLMNALSSFNTYHTTQVDVVTPDIDGKIRHLPISFITRIHPSK